MVIGYFHLHVPNCTFSYGPCFSERHLSHQVTQIRNLGTILNSSSLTNWLSSVDFLSFLPGSFLSLGHDGDDNDLDSYNIFLTGLCLQSCHPPQFIFFRLLPEWCFQNISLIGIPCIKYLNGSLLPMGKNPKSSFPEITLWSGSLLGGGWLSFLIHI